MSLKIYSPSKGSRTKLHFSWSSFIMLSFQLEISTILFRMVDLVGKTNLKLIKLIISNYFFLKKKVRSFSGLSGPPSGPSARLKFKSVITVLNIANFANLKEICTTKSTILNGMALFKLQK